MAIGPSHHDDRGFTLIEMVVILAIVGIVSAFALPSLVSFNKPLRDGTNQFVSQLALIRSKAISSSKAYRIRPKYPNRADYTGGRYSGVPRNFIVEYAANCQVTKYGTGSSSNPDGWQSASQLDLDLPESVGIDTTTDNLPPATNNVPLSKAGITITVPDTTSATGFSNIPMSAIMFDSTPTSSTKDTVSFQRADLSTPTSVTYDPIFNWSICYDNRGMYYSSKLNETPGSTPKTLRIVLKDYQGNNRAAKSLIKIEGIGQLNIATYNRSNADITATGNPVY